VEKASVCKAFDIRPIKILIDNMAVNKRYVPQTKAAK
jgi:hypothetical protein